MIPSMGGTEIGKYLEKYARLVPDGACIVEVGAWLGAGSYHLCKGAAANPNEPDVHLFDRWTASASEVEKAQKAGVRLIVGNSLKPFVEILLSQFEDLVHITMTQGEISEFKYFNGGAIGLYVDDACKRQPDFDHAMKVFKPSFIDGAIVVLMDFHFYRKKPELCYQRDYIAEHGEFEYIMDLPRTSAAVFRYSKI